MALPWMPIYWGDYLADTLDLDAQDHGLYLIMLGIAWRRPDGALPNDMAWLKRSLQSVCRGLHGHTFNARVPRILKRFWTLGGDGKWLQKRLQIELKRSANLSEKQRKRSHESWENRRLAKSPAKPTTLHTTLTTQAPQQEAAVLVSNASKAVALADELAALVGVDPVKVPAFATASELLLWLDSGCDPERDIRPAVADVVAKLKARGVKPGGWGYFRNAVTRRRDERTAGLPPGTVNGHHDPEKPVLRAAAAAYEPFQPQPKLSPEEEAAHHEAAMAKLRREAERIGAELKPPEAPAPE